MHSQNTSQKKGIFTKRKVMSKKNKKTKKHCNFTCGGKLPKFNFPNTVLFLWFKRNNKGWIKWRQWCKNSLNMRQTNENNTLQCSPTVGVQNEFYTKGPVCHLQLCRVTAAVTCCVFVCETVVCVWLCAIVLCVCMCLCNTVHVSVWQFVRACMCSLPLFLLYFLPFPLLLPLSLSLFLSALYEWR